MENILTQGFDAAQALSYSAFTSRVQPSDGQHYLDIVEKKRTSALPWRGQFSPQLIEYLLTKHCKKRGRILDPFCGSGTVLREAARGGFSALGTDVNSSAVCLAKVSELARIKPELRWSLVERIREFGRDLQLSSDDRGVIEAGKAADLFFSSQLDEQEKIALEGVLLFLFSNGKSVVVSKVAKGIDRYLSVAFDSHSAQCQTEARVGDARAVDEADNTFDYLVTSPPYINVFNYHQNHRPIIEALGHTPLTAAKAEIGANRKFRQNRYMTVV